MKYSKSPFTLDEHIKLLISRGLIIPDKERAKKYIRNVGYFRITGYMYHLQKKDGSHEFKEDVTFDDIILHYKFDKQLRALFSDYLERIEISIRARLTDNFTISNGFYWYTKPSLYADLDVHSEINQEIKKRFRDGQERYIKSFKYKYSAETSLPSNMAMEVLSFGKLSRLYEALKNNDDKVSIATELKLVSSILSSWLIHLTNVRNVCAHHSRLWNRQFTAYRPLIPTRKNYKFHGELPNDFNTTIYGVISILERLLREINPDNSFIKKFILLIDQHPKISTELMGFPVSWREGPAWLADSK